MKIDKNTELTLGLIIFSVFLLWVGLSKPVKLEISHLYSPQTPLFMSLFNDRN